MPRPDQLVSVSIQDKGKVGEKRRITIDIEAPGELFLLADLLSKEGATKDLEVYLKAANRKAVGQYVLGAKEFIRSRGNGEVKKKKSEKAGGRQDKRSGATSLQATDVLSEKQARREVPLSQ